MSPPTIAERQSLRAYLAQVGHTASLSASEELEIARRFRRAKNSNESARARTQLVVANLRLVVMVARQYDDKGVPLLDLIQEGNVGLLSAVERFDPERGFRFSTYATWWIRRSIRRVLARNASIAKTWTPEGDGSTEVDPDPTPLDRAVAVSEWDDVLEQISRRLTPREARVLQLRYGLASGEPRSLRSVASTLNISPEGVRRAEQRALAVLQGIRAPSRRG